MTLTCWLSARSIKYGCAAGLIVNVFQAVQMSKGWRPPLPRKAPKQLLQVTSMCWQQDHRARWSAAQAVEALEALYEEACQSSCGSGACVPCVLRRSRRLVPEDVGKQSKGC